MLRLREACKQIGMSPTWMLTVVASESAGLAGLAGLVKWAQPYVSQEGLVTDSCAATPKTCRGAVHRVLQDLQVQ